MRIYKTVNRKTGSYVNYNYYMQETFKLAITPNYGKVIKKMLIFIPSILLPIVLFGIALEKRIINPDSKLGLKSFFLCI